jgi:glycerol-3-phosphate responsive antiterminator
VHVGDRESDIYELFCTAQDVGTQIISILTMRIANRIPLIAAGSIRTPEQAEVAVTGGSCARTGRDSEIQLSISADDVVDASIPQKLWTIIESTLGWFNVTATESKQSAYDPHHESLL